MADRVRVVTLYRDKTSGTLHTDAPLGENWRESFDAVEYVPKQELTQAEERVRVLYRELRNIRHSSDTLLTGVQQDAIDAALSLDSSTGSR